MAVDRLSFLTEPPPQSEFRGIYHNSLQTDFILRSPGTIFSSLHFVPEKIVDFTGTPEGVRYYKVKWQETWLAEHQIVQYQNHQAMISAYWLQRQSEISTSQSTNVEVAKVNSKQAEGDVEPQPSTNDMSSGEKDVLDRPVEEDVTVEIQTQKENSLINQMIEKAIGGETNQTLNSEIEQKGHEVISSQPVSYNVVLNEASLTLPNTHSAENETGNQDEIMVEIIALGTHPTESKVGALSKFSTTAAAKKKKHCIQMEGFDLVNIENFQVTEEEMKHQAIETLNSFKRKRVRFPNGTSKLPQTCFFCLRIIANRKKLREHQFSTHFKNVGEFTCQICTQRFVFKRQLKEHLVTHSDIRSFKCDICGLTCKRRSHLHKHMDTHKKERNYRCDVCHQNFKVQADLKAHCLSDHRNQVMKCNVCKQTLHTANSVYLHSMRHSGTRDHICGVCGARFKRKQHLIAHVTIHESEKESFQCPSCSNIFSDKKNLRKHIEQAHKEIAGHFKYDYTCEICNKDFAYKGRLDEHMKTHENETETERVARLRKKKVDSLSDTVMEQLKDKYVKMIDPKNGEVRMKCKICTNREFRMISSLEKHVQDHKSGKIPPKKPAIYPCEDCKKLFNSKARLREHRVMNHQEQKTDRKEILKKQSLPQCKKCNKSFKWKSCLQAHVKKCAGQVKKGANKRKATLKAIAKLQEQIIDLSSDEDISIKVEKPQFTKIVKKVSNEESSKSGIWLNYMDPNSVGQSKEKQMMLTSDDGSPLLEPVKGSNLESISVLENTGISLPIELIKKESSVTSSDSDHSIIAIKEDNVNHDHENQHYFIIEQADITEEVSNIGSPLCAAPDIGENITSESVLMQVEIQESSNQSGSETRNALVETLINLGTRLH